MAQSKLDIAIEELGRFFGVTSKSAFYNKLLEMEEITPVGTTRPIQDRPVVTTMGEMLLSNLEGGYRTHEILTKIDEWLAGTPPVKSANEAGDDSSAGTAAAEDELRKVVEIVFEPDKFPGKSTCVAKTVPKIGGDLTGDIPWYGSYDEEAKADVCPELASAPKIDPEEAALFEAKHAPTMKGMICSPGLLAAVSARAGDAEGSPQAALAAKLQAATTINTAVENPSRATPVLSAFMIKPAALTPANRDTGAMGIFMNFIPSTEMSRCVPWLDIQIISARPPLNAEKRISTMSIAQFLMGNVEITDEATADYSLATGANASILQLLPPSTDAAADEEPDVQIATAGMELFTAPQTLVPGDDTSFKFLDGAMEHADDSPGGVDGARAAPIIDKFRPFMTITGFDVSVTPSYGMMAHETATLSITLHDRSRLAEIGELVKPDLYGAVELLIEYGWNHPDGQVVASSSINPIGNFLNAMKCKKKFKVRNSSFSFDEVGQVEIGLELYSVGLINFDTSHIGKMPGMESTMEKINEALQVIRRIKRETEPAGGAADTTGESWIGSADSLGEIQGLDDETMLKIREFMKKARDQQNDGDASPTSTEMLGALDTLIGPSGDTDGGLVNELKTSIAMALQVKKNHVISSNSGDPFWRPIIPETATELVYFPKILLSASSPSCSFERYTNQRIYGTSEDDFNKDRTAYLTKHSSGPPFVSLGKLLLLYVGTPLASDAAFDEVQFYFYAFNADASFMCNRNIAEFPINAMIFFEELEKITKTSAFINLRRFLGMLQSKFISKLDNEAWGMQSMYEMNDEGNRVMKEEWKENPVAMRDHKTKILAAAYGEDVNDPKRPLRFKKPRIAVHTEGIPALSASADGVDGKVTTIMKFHIYDKACTTHTGVQQLLSASRRGQISQISKEVRELKRADEADRAGHEEALKAVLDEAESSWHLLEKDPGDTRVPPAYRIKGGFPKLKAFIKSSMPSATYGTATSAILSASVTSMNDPQLASIMMQRQGQGSASTPLSARSAGVPMRTVPVQVELELFGCPVVAYGQQMFLDFGTGTTVDNIYAVNGIDHSIKSGEFTTKIKMVQLDAFGAYEGALTQISAVANELNRAEG